MNKNYTETLNNDDLQYVYDQMAPFTNPGPREVNSVISTLLNGLKEGNEPTFDNDHQPHGVLQALLHLEVFIHRSTYHNWALPILNWLREELSETGIILEDLNVEEGRKIYGGFSPGFTFIKMLHPTKGEKLVILMPGEKPLLIVDLPLKLIGQ